MIFFCNHRIKSLIKKIIENNIFEGILVLYFTILLFDFVFVFIVNLNDFILKQYLEKSMSFPQKIYSL